jgi:predicted TIM-barrel fold metal-dependent hydrolase
MGQITVGIVTKMIDLSKNQIIDEHCHAFLPEKETARNVSLAQLLHWTNAPEEENKNLLLYRRVLRELSRILECDSADETLILRVRDATYTAGNREKQIEYVGKLFDDAKISWLFFDTGYPSSQYPDSYDADAVSLSEVFAKQKFNFIFRLDELMWRLFKQDLSFEDMLSKYVESLNRAVKQDKCIAFKSANAYCFGLDIHDKNEREAKKAYEELRSEQLLTVPIGEKMSKNPYFYPELPPTIAEEKILRDFLTCRGIEESIKLDVPVQVHTGVGDTPIINPYKFNPIYLIDLLKDPKFEKAKFVLVHAGYPYVEEMGWLVNGFPNVCADLSEMVPWMHIGIRQKIMQLMEMAPMNKIMYGSDGGKFPESYWIAAILIKQELANVLQELVDSKYIDEDYAYKVGSWILSENSRRVYRV